MRVTHTIKKKLAAQENATLVDPIAAADLGIPLTFVQARESSPIGKIRACWYQRVYKRAQH